MPGKKTTIVLAVLVCAIAAFFAIAANAQTTNEAVCKLYRTGTQRHSGSGTFVGVSDDGRFGLVISCYHVCGGKQSMDCVFKNRPGIEATPFTGKVMKLDSRYDLAAMVIPNPGFPPAAIGDFKRHAGIYSACGYGGGKYSAARGVCYSFDSTQTWTRCGIWPGHSGGGLFDPFGRWCGVTNWNNGTNGPNPNGFTRSRSGDPLQKFVYEASYECGPFRNLFKGRGGGGDGGECPDGHCPNPSVPGSGYGLAPGYQPLTPLASQPGAVIPPTTPQVQPAPFSAPITVVPPTTQPAPVPDAPQPQRLPVVEGDRVAVLEGMMRQIAKKLDVDIEPAEGDSGELLRTLPTVELNLRYPDGQVKSTIIDLRQRVLKEFGADEQE